jgi:hypothetical protein
LQIEDDVRVRKRDGPHQLREVAFRGRNAGGSWRRAHRRKCDLREHAFAKLGGSRLELAGLEHERQKIG